MKTDVARRDRQRADITDIVGKRGDTDEREGERESERFGRERERLEREREREREL